MNANLDFSATIAERTRDFAGREWLFAEIDRWLADPDAPQVFLLTGEPGIGKTAVAARLTQFSTGDETPPADYAHVGLGFLSAVHFCSARNGGWISPDGFARSLSAQLAARYPAFADALASDPRIHIEQRVGTVSGTLIGAQITNYYAETSEALFNDLVRTPLQTICGRDGLPGPLTILADGLDESLNYSGRTNIVRLLVTCWDLRLQVRLLLTSRPVDGVLEPFRPLRPFILYARSEENRGDVGAYVDHRFATSAALRDRAGDEVRVERIRDSLVARSGGNFLVVSKVLDGVERGELSLAEPEALPADLQDFYAWFLDRLTRGDMSDWWDLYCPVLGVLAVAQEPVDAPTLCQWTGLTRQQMIKALHNLREFLDPALDGRYRTYHESMVDFLTGDEAGPYYLDVAEYHRQIAEGYTQRFVENGEGWPDCDVYGLRHLPLHLLGAEQTETLRRLLFGFDWLQAKLDATGIAALVADFDLLPDDKGLHLVRESLRLSAHVLTNDKTQLWGQLYGRLMAQEIPDIRAMLAAWPEAPWLRLVAPSLTPPGGLLLRTLKGHRGGVGAVAVMPDGRRVISGGGDGILKVWNLESGVEEQSLIGHESHISAVAVTPDGRRVISGGGDGILKVWNLESGVEEQSLIGHKSDINAVAVTPDGRRVISGGGNGILKMWNLESGVEEQSLIGHKRSVDAVAVTPDGRRVISGGGDGILKVWNLESGVEEQSLIGHKRSVNAVAVMPDGRRIVTCQRFGTIKIWNLESGVEERELKGYGYSIWVVAVTPDGRRAVSGSWSGNLTVWDLEGGPEAETMIGHGLPVTAVVVPPDGRWAVSGSLDGTVKVWDLERGTERGTTPTPGHSGMVTALAVTPDGRWAVSGSTERPNLKVWDLGSGAEVGEVSDVRGVDVVAVMPGGRRVMFGGRYRYWLMVLDLETGGVTYAGRTLGAIAVGMTPDGQLLGAGISGRRLNVWDVGKGVEKPVFTDQDNEVGAVTMTPDGRRVVSGTTNGRIIVWGMEKRMKERTLTGHESAIEALAVTPDGRLAVSGASDGTLKVWDLETGIEIHTLTPQGSGIKTVAVTSNGRRGLSVAEDHVLRVWDLESETLIATFSGDGGITICAVAPDGVTIVAAEVSGQVHSLRLERVEPLEH